MMASLEREIAYVGCEPRSAENGFSREGDRRSQCKSTSVKETRKKKKLLKYYSSERIYKSIAGFNLQTLPLVHQLYFVGVDVLVNNHSSTRMLDYLRLG